MSKNIWKKALSHQDYKEVMFKLLAKSKFASECIEKCLNIPQNVFDELGECRQLLTNGYSTFGKEHEATKFIINSCDRVAYRMFLYNETKHDKDIEACQKEINELIIYGTRMYKLASSMSQYSENNLKAVESWT